MKIRVTEAPYKVGYVESNEYGITICEGCKGSITKNDLRLAVMTEVCSNAQIISITLFFFKYIRFHNVCFFQTSLTDLTGYRAHNWYHFSCFFATGRSVKNEADFSCFHLLRPDDQERIRKQIKQSTSPLIQILVIA